MLPPAEPDPSIVSPPRVSRDPPAPGGPPPAAPKARLASVGAVADARAEGSFRRSGVVLAPRGFAEPFEEMAPSQPEGGMPVRAKGHSAGTRFRGR